MKGNIFLDVYKLLCWVSDRYVGISFLIKASVHVLNTCSEPMKQSGRPLQIFDMPSGLLGLPYRKESWTQAIQR